ncbi:MAG: peptide ABC transporter substrate-binding protein [Chloroflexota bacterium]
MKARTRPGTLLRLSLSLALALAIVLTSCTAAPAPSPTAAPQPAPTKAPAASPAPQATTTAAPSPSVAQPTANEPRKGGQITVGISQEPQGMNPILSFIEVGRGIHYALFDSPWRMSDKGELIPNLATEIPTVANGGISNDGLEYTLKLRKGVKWHDGQPFTSKDVKFTWETIMNPNLKIFTRSGYDQVEKVETPDDYTVKFKLKAPYAPFVNITLQDMYIVPEHVLSKVADINTADFNTKAPIGTGPFKFKEWVAGSHITVEANRDYHGPGPYVDRIIYKIVPDTLMLYTQFKTGEIDIIGLQGIPVDQFADAKKLPDRVVQAIETSSFESITLNVSKPWFQDKRVRQALFYGMDLKPILEKVYLGVNPPIETYVPLASPYYNKNLPKHEYNPDKAKQLLDEAGWKLGPDGIRVKDGVRLSFDNSTTAGDNVREQAQQLLQQQWKQIGVEMKINNMPAAVVWGDFLRLSKFDSLMIGLAVQPDPDWLFRLHSKMIPAEGGSGRNFWYYKNPEVDKLFEDGVKEVDAAKRKDIYDKVQQIIRDELPFLPMFQKARLVGYKSNLVGYSANGLVWIELWNPHQWGWAQ